MPIEASFWELINKRLIFFLRLLCPLLSNNTGSGEHDIIQIRMKKAESTDLKYFFKIDTNA